MGKKNDVGFLCFFLRGRDFSGTSFLWEDKPHGWPPPFLGVFPKKEKGTNKQNTLLCFLVFFCEDVCFSGTSFFWDDKPHATRCLNVLLPTPIFCCFFRCVMTCFFLFWDVFFWDDRPHATRCLNVLLPTPHVFAVFFWCFSPGAKQKRCCFFLCFARWRKSC